MLKIFVGMAVGSKMENSKEDETVEWLRDEITGLKHKSNMSVLNKKKLSRYELDELFATE